MKIKHRLCAFTVVVAIMSGILATWMPAFAQVNATESQELQSKSINTVSDKTRAANAEAPRVTVYINSQPLTEKGYLINDTTYVPLRAFSETVGDCTIGWNDGIATVKTDTLDLSAQQNSHYITANGRILYNSQQTRNINNRIYVPVRSMAKAYSLDVKWEGKTRTVYLSGDPKGLKRAEEYYNETDLYWLSRLIHAESSGEILLGKIAVGNVVMNRKNRKDYPNTIYGVIFDRKYGTQFSPVSMGTIYKTPSSQSVLAAKICLEGYSINSEMIFFINPRIATNFWIPQTRKFVMRIGNHDFYQ